MENDWMLIWSKLFLNPQIEGHLFVPTNSGQIRDGLKREFFFSESEQFEYNLLLTQ